VFGIKRPKSVVVASGDIVDGKTDDAAHVRVGGS
jgi:hypothetical protein